MGNALTNPENTVTLGVIHGKVVTYVTTRVGNFVNVDGDIGFVATAWIYDRPSRDKMPAMPMDEKYRTEFWDAVRAALALTGRQYRDV